MTIRRFLLAVPLVLAAIVLSAAVPPKVLTPWPMAHFEDNNGSPCTGCLLFTYIAGTTTKQNTYTNSSGATPNTNPIVLNTRGEANVWLSPGLSYKYVLSPSTDTDPPTNPFWTQDNITTPGVFTVSPPGPTPHDTFGCLGDGVTDDTVCLQAAINASQGTGTILYCGPYLYRTHAISGGPITLECSKNGGGIYNRTCLVGFLAIDTNETMFTLSGDGNKFADVCQQMNPLPNVQTAGSAIHVGPGGANVFTGGQINNPFIGIDMSGVGTIQNNSNIIDGYTIVPPSTGGGIGVLFGNNSTPQGTVGFRISNTIIDCINFATGLPTTTTTGMDFVDTAGGYITNNDIYGCGVGTKIVPVSASQFDTNLFFSNTVLGDTCGVNCLQINTTAPTNGVGLGLLFDAAWLGTSTGTLAVIHNDGAGSLDGIHFKGTRFFPSSGQLALDLAGVVSNFTAEDSYFCPQAGTGTVIAIGNSQLVTIRDSEIGECEGFTGTPAVGIAVSSGATGSIQFTGNNFFGSTTPITWTTGVATTATIKDNFVLNNLNPTLASAASLTLPFNENVYVTGTTPVSAMSTMWGNRRITIIPDSALPFATGGGTGKICNALTAVAQQQVDALWDGANSCWHVK